MWQSIIKGKNILASGIQWKVGTGSSINFWQDRWVGKDPLSSLPYVTPPENGRSSLVKDFILDNKSWNITALEEFLPANIINDIRAIPLPINEGQTDSLSWPYSGTGLVTVNSAFSFISGAEDGADCFEWIWKTKCVERIKLFLWKITMNGLLVNQERQRRGLSDDATCPRCGLGEENLDHQAMCSAKGVLAASQPANELQQKLSPATITLGGNFLFF